MFPARPAPVDRPEFLRHIGRWWDESVTNFNAGVKDSQDKLSDLHAQADQAAKDASAASQEVLTRAAQAATEAATAMIRLPNTRLIEASERCSIAGNGAPDCRAAATSACRGKGFDNGQTVGIRTAGKCPVSLWLAGRGEGECPVETVVTRAVCQ